MAKNNIGSISQVIGAVVDVKFEGDLPKRIGAMVDLLDAITPSKGQR